MYVSMYLQLSPCQPSRHEQTPGVGQWPRPPAFAAFYYSNYTNTAEYLTSDNSNFLEKI